MKDCALVVVDMLYDFIDGSMACSNALNAVQSTLAFIDKVTSEPLEGPEVIQAGYPILFVRDSHPADHSSFTTCGGPWPPHCVQGTRGAEIHEALAPYAKEELTFSKGRDRDTEQYSGFEGRNDAGQSLQEVLEMMDIKNVHVCGIATEYCVRNTCEDLSKAGFKVFLLKDCIGYVDRQGHIGALKELEKEGIRLV